MTNIVNAECPKCKVKLELRVGRKSTARVATCDSCNAKYDYSCWVIRKSPERTIHMIELFPMREDRRMWTGTAVTE